MAWFSRATERRGSPRFQAEVPLVVSLVADEEIASVRALADGISEGGLSVSNLQGLPIGQSVSLEIRLPIAAQPIWVEAVVTHDSGHYGLRFTSLTEEQRNLIRRYCRLQPRQKRRA
ncbi:MAG TPA: PilZ domain-containing protein [Terriglobales bacterium]|nr:PilZ domain-containing protein [Terriglobales bacterium]